MLKINTYTMIFCQTYCLFYFKGEIFCFCIFFIKSILGPNNALNKTGHINYNKGGVKDGVMLDNIF